MNNGNRLSLGALFFLAHLFTGCGLETTLPASEETQPSERAVFIQKIDYTEDGVEVTCELNQAIIQPGMALPLFIEFEGDRIETTTVENVTSFRFAGFRPPREGAVVCVVEFADAEFESERQVVFSIDP